MAKQKASKEVTEQRARYDQEFTGFRNLVLEEELIARMNKATWEKMHFFIEGTKITGEYNELLEKAKAIKADYEEKQAEAFKKFQDEQTGLNDGVGPDPNPNQTSIENVLPDEVKEQLAD